MHAMADSTVPILKRVLELILERGWTMYHSAYSMAYGGPLNLRTAVQKAQHELYPGCRDAQISALQCLTVQLGGIQNWEAGTKGGRPRSHDEVVAKLRTIIEDVEEHGPKELDGHRAHRSDFGKRPAGKRDAGTGPGVL